MSVQQFLFREARLLDERRFDEWLALFSDDCFYWMPTRFNRLRDGIDETWQVDKETEGLDGLAYFEDNKQILRRRVERLKTGMAWAEDPPSRRLRKEVWSPACNEVISTRSNVFVEGFKKGEMP